MHTWLKIRRGSNGRNQYNICQLPERNALSDVPYIPVPIVHKKTDRIPFSCWSMIYRNEICHFIDCVMAAIDEGISEIPFHRMIVSISELPELHEDLEHWLYKHSSSALRNMQDIYLCSEIVH